MSKIRDAQARIDAAAGRAAERRAKLHGLNAQAVTMEGRRDDPAAIAQAAATRQAMAAIEEDIKRIDAIELPAARERLRAVEGERRALAQSIEDAEKRIAPYAARLDVMERAAALLLDEIRKARANDTTNDRRALALLLWIRGMIEERKNLPAWRSRLEREY